jgi:hypothetical protein
MSLLPHHQLDAIKAVLEPLELKNLVAVFSQASASACLLVYLGQPPAGLPRTIQAISINELPDQDLAGFNGLTIAFSALDVLRPDRLTKGPRFYALERLFLERQQQGLLFQGPTPGQARK